MDNIIKVRVPEYTKLCSAATECEAILRALGYNCPYPEWQVEFERNTKFIVNKVVPKENKAEVYISEEDREIFRNELLYKTVQGISSRKFFFGKCIHPLLGENPDEFVVNYIR